MPQQLLLQLVEQHLYPMCLGLNLQPIYRQMQLAISSGPHMPLELILGPLEQHLQELPQQLLLQPPEQTMCDMPPGNYLQLNFRHLYPTS